MGLLLKEHLINIYQEEASFSFLPNNTFNVLFSQFRFI